MESLYVNKVSQEDVVEIVFDDITYQVQKQFPQLNKLFLDYSFISIKLLKETNDFNKKLLLLKLLFKHVDLNDFDCDTPVSIEFYIDDTKLKKQILFLYPGAINVDKYQQLEKILQNN